MKRRPSAAFLFCDAVKRHHYPISPWIHDIRAFLSFGLMVFPSVSPFLIRNRVGNTSTLNFFGNCSFRSQLTLPTSTCPASSDATASRTGDNALQWWHQGAQKSMSTGIEDVSSILEKLSSFIAIGMDIISFSDIAFPFH